MGGLYLGGKLVTPVIEKEVAKTKFGASVDTWIGDVDENGVLNEPTWRGALNFVGVKEIGSAGLKEVLYNRIMGGGVFFPDLIRIAGGSSLINAFESTYCTDISMPNLLEISGSNACRRAFVGSTAQRSGLDKLKTISGSAACHSMYLTCRSLTEPGLNNLESITGDQACFQMFSYCNLSRVDFPKLTAVSPVNAMGTSSSNGMFASNSNLTEIHFRADAQAVIEGLTGYSSKFGATSSTIYFDL